MSLNTQRMSATKLARLRRKYEVQLRKIDSELEKVAPDSHVAIALRTARTRIIYQIVPSLGQIDFMRRAERIILKIEPY